MKCQNCGRELKNGARFCIHCGAQHDEYGQLIGGGSSGSVNYDQTMMASNQGGADYDKTMMFGSTGFNQYSSNDMSQGYGQDNYGYEESGYYETKTKAKKKISPIIIICPILIVLILGFSVFGGKLTKKGGKKVSKTTELTKETSPIPVSVATVSNIVEEFTETTAETPVVKDYWDVNAEYFYENGVLQKNKWVGEFYVGKDGKKVRNDWIDDKYYVDAEGKRARNELIKWTYYDKDGHKKEGFYYVGEDGLKVKNKEVDGRYFNENGVCIENFDQPSSNKTSSETKETTTKETTTKESSNKNNTDTSKKDREKTEETSETIKEARAAETTAASVVYSTTQATQTSQQIYAQTTQASTVMETSPVASPVINPNATAPQNSSVIYATTQPSTSGSGTTTTTTGGSDGVTYQLVSLNFPEYNITRYDQIVITDTKYPDLMASVAEVTNNREMVTGYGDKVTQELKVERNDKKIFSVSEVISKYKDNKINKKDKNGWTWDATSGQVLTLEDIFVDEEKMEKCAEIVLKRLKANKSSIDEDMYEEINDLEADEVFGDCTWYLGSAGLTFVFNRDTIGAKKLDGLSYTLSYTSSSDNLNKMLKSEYRKK